MKINLTLTIILLAASAVVEVNAQQSPVKTPDKKFPTTLQPVNPVKYYGPRKEKKKKKKGKITHDAQSDYNNRIENIWKDREKREKSFERGEATDYMKPPYFGHKKPPKIRSIEKRKYCKVCGIRH